MKQTQGSQAIDCTLAAGGDAGKYSAQRIVHLDPGETCAVRLEDGTEKKIRLVSVAEHADPVVHLLRRAEVRIEIDGRAVALACTPYVMPSEIMGLRIQADTTSAWLDIPKRVQLSVWDPADPIVATGRFGFPLPGYRLFSHGMQAYNEPVHLGSGDGDPAGGCFYHNYGVDFAGYEGRQKVISCIDGVVVRTNHDMGDVAVRDDRGFVLHFGHLDSILAGIREGAPVVRGQWVGMLGRRGASGNFSHLHVGAYLSEEDFAADRSARGLNLYPWLVAAYRSAGGEPLSAVARPHQTAFTGEAVRFDGTSSMAPGSGIAELRWEFHDGTVVNAPIAEKAYSAPGCYSAALWARDTRGRTDVDFCKIKVFSRGAPEDGIPALFVTLTPSRGVRVDQPVFFKIWPQGAAVDHIAVDFGNGSVVRDYRPESAIAHRFASPGIHVVTAAGAAGALPVSQKVKIVVESN